MKCSRKNVRIVLERMIQAKAKNLFMFKNVVYGRWTRVLKHWWLREARKIKENTQKYNEREINRARQRRERDDKYRGQLLRQVQQDSIRRMRVALPQESYIVHKRALREAIKWRNSRHLK